MNISTDRKVVLQPLRDVPHEVMIHTSTAEKDQHISNRYWFKFPQQWSNQVDKESIIGVRNIYLARHNRHVYFNLYVALAVKNDDGVYDDATYLGLYKMVVSVYMDADDNIKHLCRRFWDWFPDNMTTMEEAEGFSHTFTRGEIEITYYHEDGECKILIGRPIGSDSETVLNNTTGSYQECIWLISAEPLDDDAKVVLGLDDGMNVTINRIVKPIWSRYACYVKSSISNEAEDQFLGHTRAFEYTPIKYYRLTSDFKKWWIELYDSRDHRCKVTLPSDGLDDIFIEGIVCFSAKDML